MRCGSSVFEETRGGIARPAGAPLQSLNLNVVHFICHLMMVFSSAMSVDVENESEAALVAGLQSGSPAAFRMLYDHFAQRLELFVRSRCPSEADDLIQQTWLKVWNSRERFEGGQLGAWIFTIARNTIYDHFRKARPETLANESIEISEMATQSLRLEWEEELAELRDCSERLPEAIRRIVLQFYNGVPGEKIAAAEDIERSTVYTRVHRALASLRKCMEQKRSWH